MTRATLFLVMTAALAALALEPAPRLLWNPTRSAPQGWWLVTRTPELEVGDWAAVAPPPKLTSLLAQRGYLPAGLPLLKRVAAVEGQTICRLRDVITVDGRAAGRARARDTQGRPLQRWSGCLRVPRGSLFFMNAAPDSFDGRYFGLVRARLVLGRAVPLHVLGAS